jgi:diacylglycerol diphosphate phosphatase/phosphatidate phosphatase
MGDWRLALAAQDWISFATFVPVAIASIVVDGHVVPAVRPFSLYDATISLPYGASTIPYWVTVVAPLVLLLLTFALGELRAPRGDAAGARRAPLAGARPAGAARAVHFALDLLEAFVCVGAITTALKLAVGVHRPDFLDRCQPALPPPGDVTLAYGAGAASNAACLSDISARELRDGSASFPSGHASTAFVFASYGCTYCLWAFCGLRDGGAARPAGAARARLAADARAAAALWFMLAQLGWAWGVAASRVIDNKHAPGDVASGALLGAGFGVTFAVRAIARRNRLPAEPAAPPAGELAALCGGGGSGAATPPRAEPPSGAPAAAAAV